VIPRQKKIRSTERINKQKTLLINWEEDNRAINTLAPPGLEYEHKKAWHDGNGHSHVQAALLEPSIVLPIRNGKLRRGTWQQVVAINHDNRPRKRTVEVTIIGTK
jgi:secondary thiamine-phosphate synthase enzyme